MKINRPIQDSVELAQDSSFIEWVKTGEVDASWLQGLSSKELKIVSEAKTLVMMVSYENLENMDITIHNTLWNRINNTILAKERNQKKNVVIMWVSGVVGFAATFALILMMMPSKTSNQLSHYASSDNSELILPEKSRIIASQGSTVSYDQSNWNEERRIQLEGEAFFDVIKGVPFIVSTSAGDVSVLGTSFEVSETKAELAVSVTSGKVRVKTGQYQEILEANDQYFLNMTSEDYSGIKLMDGTVYYKFIDQPMGDILSLVEDIYEVTILIPESITSLDYSGYFDGGYSIEEVLTRLTEAYRLQYNINGSKVVLSE